MTPRARLCADCGVGISDRHHAAYLCVKCAKKRQAFRSNNNEWSNNRPTTVAGRLALSQAKVVGTMMICGDCGKECLRTAAAQKWCVDCATLHRLFYQQAYNRTVRLSA
jgi:hypothetical protein